MYITIETKTEQFYFETSGCSLQPMIPSQVGEPETVKTRTLIVYDVDGGVLNRLDLEPGDHVYIMNNAGKTINTIRINC